MINRRNLFGATAGAAIAGPSVAKSALMSAQSDYRWGKPAAEMAISTTLDIKPNDYARMIKNQVERIARDKKRLNEQAYINPDILAASRMDALRSISAQHKARRTLEISYQVSLERELRESEIHLSWMMEEFRSKFPLISNLETLING